MSELDQERASDSDEHLAAALKASEDCAAAPEDDGEKKGTDWWGEIKGILLLVLAVLGFHSFVAKPFYIPSESMMPGLIQGDRLVVSKYPYGWSYVSPSFHILPFMEGRLFGRMPERGDIVITVPQGARSDYIKRVVGLPGDTIELRGGAVILNGTPLRREQREPAMIPIDENVPCDDVPGLITTGSDGQRYCRMPVYREYTPEGRYYDTIDLGPSPGDFYGPITIPEGHLFLLGDNRDQSADSRAPLSTDPRRPGGLGGPVPVESIGGRAEFITFSLDGTTDWYNPISWFSAMRSGRAGTGLHPGREGEE